eukprot:CCRYP_010678-RA/>CCRYP_010678-RA protein AED:0.00 eAED:0.00 QI:50/1/1/1/0/0/2/93/34
MLFSSKRISLRHISSHTCIPNNALLQTSPTILVH